VGKLKVGDELSPWDRRLAVAELLASGIRGWKRFCMETVSATSENSLHGRLESRCETRLSVSQAVSERSNVGADHCETSHKWNLSVDQGSPSSTDLAFGDLPQRLPASASEIGFGPFNKDRYSGPNPPTSPGPLLHWLNLGPICLDAPALPSLATNDWFAPHPT
jgi:hypothetical protein